MSSAVHPENYFHLPSITDSGHHCGRNCKVQRGIGCLKSGYLAVSLWTVTGEIAAVDCDSGKEKMFCETKMQQL